MTEFITKEIIDIKKDTDAIIRFNYKGFSEYKNFGLFFFFNDTDMDDKGNVYVYNAVNLTIKNDPEYYTQRTYYNWKASKFMELLDEGMIELLPKKYENRLRKMIKSGEIKID